MNSCMTSCIIIPLVIFIRGGGVNLYLNMAMDTWAVKVLHGWKTKKNFSKTFLSWPPSLDFSRRLGRAHVGKENWPLVESWGIWTVTWWNWCLFLTPQQWNLSPESLLLSCLWLELDILEDSSGGWFWHGWSFPYSWCFAVAAASPLWAMLH